MLSLKRRLSSLSLRQKTYSSDGPSTEVPTEPQPDLIKAEFPSTLQSGSLEVPEQSAGTITPLINGIRDIIDDVLPIPSARHVPPELQRRLSALPRAPSSHVGSVPLSYERPPQPVHLPPEHADVLVVEDVSVAAVAGAGIVSGTPHAPEFPQESYQEVQRALPSESSLVWDLPQLPYTSGSRKGTSRPQSRALTPASPGMTPASNHLRKSEATKSGVYAYGQSPSAGSAQGQRWSPGASSQVLKLDQLQDRQPAGATAANRARNLSPLKGRQSLAHLQRRVRERRSSQASRRFSNASMEDPPAFHARSPSPSLGTGTDAQSLNDTPARPSRPTQQRKRSPASGPAKTSVVVDTKPSKWMAQSAQLRLAMQANKGGSKGAAAAAMLAQTHEASLVPCPHCGRSFSETAAERHIPKCQDIVHKPSRLMAGGGTGAHQRVQKYRR